jgi:hypothetical protein
MVSVESQDGEVDARHSHRPPTRSAGHSGVRVAPSIQGGRGHGEIGPAKLDDHDRASRHG